MKRSRVRRVPGQVQKETPPPLGAVVVVVGGAGGVVVGGGDVTGVRGVGGGDDVVGVREFVGGGDVPAVGEGAAPTGVLDADGFEVTAVTTSDHVPHASVTFPFTCPAPVSPENQ